MNKTVSNREQLIKELESSITEDGRIYTVKMDLKTINKTGKWTIKGAMEKAVSQDARVAVLIQNTKSMTRDYMESQINLK